MSAVLFVCLPYVIVQVLVLEIVLRHRINDDGEWRWVVFWLPIAIAKLIPAPILVVLGVWAAYETATAVRNWWHGGRR